MTSKPCIIRPYRPDDREDIRRICCETGFMGNPIDPIFSDRRAFADFFTNYYTFWEPESCFVAVAEGQVIGYLTGCLRHLLHPWAQGAIFMGKIVPRVAYNLLRGRYDARSRDFILWTVKRAFFETPKKPRNSAHFHINLLPEWRNGTASRRLVFTFLEAAKRRGARRVYGQIQTFEDRRHPCVFERYGFQFLDRRQITKFAPDVKMAVYVSTYVKELAV
ncbi:MAG: GNAT family acetyltransferase [Deltaproteobacteria bacterium]